MTHSVKYEKHEVYIELCDGSRWYPDRDGHEFYPEVVASSLSKLCRFTGHIRDFYSVAEHSVKVSHMVPAEYALEGLLHDAHEILVGDIAHPIKHFIGKPYRDLSSKAEREMRESFGLPEVMSGEVKLADIYMGLIEAHSGMPTEGRCWAAFQDYRDMALSAARDNPYLNPGYWPPERAEQEFMLRYKMLTQR